MSKSVESNGVIIREVERTAKEAVVAQSKYEERSYLRITGTSTCT